MAISLIELFNTEYTCPIVMPLKKVIFGNWIEKQMYRDYFLINHKKFFYQYSMPMPKDLFDVVKFY